MYINDQIHKIEYNFHNNQKQNQCISKALLKSDFIRDCVPPVSLNVILISLNKKNIIDSIHLLMVSVCNCTLHIAYSSTHRKIFN